MVAIDRFLFRRPQKKSIEGKQTSIKFLCDPNGCPCIRPSAAPSACQSILKRVSVFQFFSKQSVGNCYYNTCCFTKSVNCIQVKVGKKFSLQARHCVLIFANDHVGESLQLCCIPVNFNECQHLAEPVFKVNVAIWKRPLKLSSNCNFWHEWILFVFPFFKAKPI